MMESDAVRRVVALLPMKAHSERVKGKNFRDFYGKPLYAWVLDRLLAIEEIGQIVINTDARDVLAKQGLHESLRIVIRDRSPELCGDFVSMNRIIEDDIRSVEADTYLMTHTTNPLIGKETIQAALADYDEGLKQNRCDSLFAVNRFQTRFYSAEGEPINHDPNDLIRTQDLDVWYEENSNLYIFNAASFAATGARIGERPALFEMQPWESVDIDDARGWRLAELIARGLSGENS
jgi:CMP-N-acetylneuraminic acid synthetase